MYTMAYITVYMTHMERAASLNGSVSKRFLHSESRHFTIRFKIRMITKQKIVLSKAIIFLFTFCFPIRAISGIGMLPHIFRPVSGQCL